MAQLLKQSTAITIKLGPFVDATAPDTPLTGLTIAQADVRLSKNGGNYAQKNESSSATHDELGEYDVALDTTDTGTLGRLKVIVAEAGALPVWETYMVVPANVYDSLVGASDKLQVDVAEWLGTAPATPTVAGVPEVDLTHIAGTTDPATRLGHGAKAIGFGTVDSGATTSSIPTSALSPAASVVNQFKNRVLVFKADTTTTNLQGVAARITASTSGGTFTVTPALPATPAAGDVFEF